jgi:hypothetical protein
LLRTVTSVVHENSSAYASRTSGRELTRIEGCGRSGEFWMLMDEAVKQLQAAPACPARTAR